MPTARDIVTNALYEMGAFQPGETPAAENFAFALSKLNRLLDTWSAKKIFIFAMQFLTFTASANKNPQSIGKGFAVTNVSITSDVATIVGIPSRPFFGKGDEITSLNIPTASGAFNVTAVVLASVSEDGTTLTFALTHADVAPTAVTAGVIIPSTLPANAAPDFVIPTTRPVKIVNGNQLLYGSGDGQVVRVPMRIVDADWWANQRTPTVQTNLPTNLYYQPNFPNGLCFFWPVLNISQQVELEIWQTLQNLQADDTFELPQGYEDAVTFTLAETLCPSYQRPVDDSLAAFATASRSAVTGLNQASLTITTGDLGMPGKGCVGRADFNWKTGNLAG